LAEIWSHVATEASETIATLLLARLAGAWEHLPEFPLLGPSRDTLAPGLRVIFEGNYAIYYKASETELLIVRVLHGARDAAAMSERGGFE
jgi:toxin ParE1/3/4